MTAYILRRILYLVPVFFGVTIITFSLINLAPGDLAESLLIQRGVQPTSETLQFVRETMGLNDPLPVRYFRWLAGLAQGDLGESYRTGRPVFEELADRFPATAQLTAVAMVIVVLGALPIGIIAAVKHGSLLDQTSRVFALGAASMPNFWLGLLLVLVFGVKFRLLPISGKGGVQHIIMPAITLAAPMTAILTRLTRSSMLEVLSQDYIRTARSKGLSEVKVIGLHALKNAFLPIITLIGMYFAHLLGGTVIVETVFSWPGVGKYVVDSILFRDYPVIQGFVVMMAFITVLTNLVVDVSYHWIDPRLTFAAKE